MEALCAGSAEQLVAMATDFVGVYLDKTLGQPHQDEHVLVTAAMVRM